MAVAITIVLLVIVGAIVGVLLDFTGSIFLGLVLPLIFIGAVITKEALERQNRIQKMKRYRNSVRAQKAALTAEDKRTMI